MRQVADSHGPSFYSMDAVTIHLRLYPSQCIIASIEAAAIDRNHFSPNKVPVNGKAHPPPEPRPGAPVQEPLFKKYQIEAPPLTRGLVSCTGSQFCGIALIETKQRALSVHFFLSSFPPSFLSFFAVFLSSFFLLSFCFFLSKLLSSCLSLFLLLHAMRIARQGLHHHCALQQLCLGQHAGVASSLRTAAALLGSALRAAAHPQLRASPRNCSNPSVRASPTEHPVSHSFCLQVVEKLEAQLDIPQGIRMHWTGCPNSCGQVCSQDH